MAVENRAQLYTQITQCTPGELIMFLHCYLLLLSSLQRRHLDNLIPNKPKLSGSKIEVEHTEECFS